MEKKEREHEVENERKKRLNQIAVLIFHVFSASNICIGEQMVDYLLVLFHINKWYRPHLSICVFHVKIAQKPNILLFHVHSFIFFRSFSSLLTQKLNMHEIVILLYIFRISFHSNWILHSLSIEMIHLEHNKEITE